MRKRPPLAPNWLGPVDFGARMPDDQSAMLIQTNPNTDRTPLTSTNRPVSSGLHATFPQ